MPWQRILCSATALLVALPCPPVLADASAPAAPGARLPTGAGACATPPPSFQDLEAAGVKIGEIRIDAQNIFDLTDPKEDLPPFRLANELHIKTRAATIRKLLLFRSGDRLSARLVEETDRVLRTVNFLQDVRIEPMACHDGIVDLKVTTRDTWSLQPTIHFSREGGSSSKGLSLREDNVLGTGISLSVKQTADADRDGTEFSIANPHAWGGWTKLEFRRGLFSDGNTLRVRAEQPFHQLDSRWAAGAWHNSKVETVSVFDGGITTTQYKSKSESDEAYVGYSTGLVKGWARRYSAGLKYETNDYFALANAPSPALLPPDDRRVAPFVRVQWVEDDFARLTNRDQIQRVEYLHLGFNATLQLERALTGLGSTRNLWTYSGDLSQGVEFDHDHHLLWRARYHGLYGDAGIDRQEWGAGVKYFRPQRGRGLLFAAVSFDSVAHGNAADQLVLGGDNGLRGYPLRYQAGDRRALLQIEQRGYSDWYPLRLFRVGAAAYVDVGRAWGGVSQNAANPGWLGNVGIVLRFLSARASFGNVLHVDLAFPFQREPGIPSSQFLVKAYSTF